MAYTVKGNGTDTVLAYRYFWKNVGLFLLSQQMSEPVKLNY
jgi:hypothetical protein